MIKHPNCIILCHPVCMSMHKCNRIISMLPIMIMFSITFGTCMEGSRGFGTHEKQKRTENQVIELRHTY